MGEAPWPASLLGESSLRPVEAAAYLDRLVAVGADTDLRVGLAEMTARTGAAAVFDLAPEGGAAVVSAT